MPISVEDVTTLERYPNGNNVVTEATDGEAMLFVWGEPY